ncbi:MAG: response regulator transcription factor [Eggerthellaceae bacterium]|nr:response regulator transcription factor [Eggerthellaceae bacterium]
MHVLLAEDDERLAEALKKILEDNGYEIDHVEDGQAALEYATAVAAQPYDVIVMDVMMPKMDGFEATRQIRRASVSTPIILLTARDAVGDKITGLDAGADDYMTKPFSPAELMAHLRALTRRQGEVQFESLKVGDLTLGLEDYELTCGDKSIQLSFKEFSIMKILMSSAGTIISKETLIQKAWGVSSSAGDNNVEAYISFLRKKLKHLGSSCSIETVRRAGYRFVG